MKKEQFDRVVSEVRNERADEKVVAAAGERVWKNISGSSPEIELDARALRSCEDFQALIPRYLAKSLPASRMLLVQDHVHECVACRHAVERARGAETQVVWRVSPKPNRSRIWNWAQSATAVAAVAALTFAFNMGYFPGQHPVRAAVQSVDGSLYAVSGEQVRMVPAGYSIRNGDEIRTAKGSTAVVRLEDGSLVEMGERAGVAVTRGWRGTTIHLDGGQVIVQAAKQRGRLYLATDDCLVSVKGTIFSVNHGIKGSRVSVIEGLVRVSYGDRTAELRPGEEATSNPSVTKVPIKNEIEWSKDAAKYLALLGDFSILQKQIAAIPGPGLRYNSDLLPLVPDNTVIYAAIPNLSNTIGEADRLFQERLQQSPALQDWWRQQNKGNGPKVEDVLNELKTFSSYLGDEIVFAVGRTGSTYTAPVVLARVRQPGLEGFLKQEGGKLSHDPSRSAVQIVRDPAAATAGSGHVLLVYLSDGLLIASPKAAELQNAALHVKESSSRGFVGTPFYQQISVAYQQGAAWLFSADMEQIVGKNVPAHVGNTALQTGVQDMRYLTLEHRDTNGKPESRAALTFASERHGLAALLAAPASMGSLEFVSPEASMATSVVIKNPKSILVELFNAIGGSDSDFAQHVAEFEKKTGVRVVDDIAAPLGGEATLAFDGPIVPTPRWKLIFEVYDPTTLQATISKLIDSYNRENPQHAITLTQKQVGAQTYYKVSATSQGGGVEINYSFVDSYLVAAPDAGTISRAIQIHQAGLGLTHSATFRATLPNDGYTNFSAIFYHNIGPVVGPLAEQLKSSGTLTPEQRRSIDALTANSAPGMIYAYGEPNRIVVASNSGFMGLDLGTLFTMGHNGPFSTQMMLGGKDRHPSSQTQ